MEKTYEDGLNEAWRFAQFLLKDESNGGIAPAEYANCYGYEPPESIIGKMDFKEVYDQYQNNTYFSIGDEIITNSHLPENMQNRGFVIFKFNDNTFLILCKDGYVVARNKYCIKTFRHNSKLAEGIQEIMEEE